MSRPTRCSRTCCAMKQVCASPISLRLPNCQVIWLIVTSGANLRSARWSMMGLVNSTNAWWSVP